ncbi:uncharacterized protein KIAA0040 homolog [Hemiscyllium ocellatum]|uniref:uncharacterized protein KIAA0040 homolog n=1 Tax=Hemiscyllium ocellatum TaxID=170820 RepID=UPI002966545E|nr:uncharacterized protein KIAA0040 homolog [Hemiscyllium ocellatum]
MLEDVRRFFESVWELICAKHNEGLYNSICLVVLLLLPVLLLILIVCLCCYGCCCGRDTCCKCCRRQKGPTKKKNPDDLWIQRQPQPIMMDNLSVPV